MTVSLTKAVGDLGMIGIGTVVDCVEFIHPTAKIYHNCVLRDGVRIDEGTVIGHLVLIERDTKIGKFTTIQSQCHITAEAEIGDYVFFGPSVVTMNEKRVANCGRREPKIEKLIVGRGARIGSGAILAPGITIGENAVIYAGSFVTKNVPAGEIWASRKDRAECVGTVSKEEWL